MAGAALVGGRQMGGRFTGGGVAIVTGDAVAVDDTVVHEGRGHKSLGSVTNIALFHGDNMGNGFARGRYAVVAAVAIPRHSLEDTVDVTGFTGGKNMLTGKRKTRGNMIEGCGIDRGIIGIRRGTGKRYCCAPQQYP